MVRKALGQAEEILISLLLVGMTLLVFVEVVLRFVFNTGFLWFQELTLHISAWFVLLGASYGIKAGSHIGVDAAVRHLPDRIQRIAAVIAVLLSLAYCGLFMQGSWVYLRKMWKIQLEMEDLPVPLWLAHSILLIGMALLALRLLQLLWRIIRGDSRGLLFADEAKETMHLAEPENRSGEPGDAAR